MPFTVKTPKDVVKQTFIITLFATLFSLSLTYIWQVSFSSLSAPGLILSAVIPPLIATPVSYMLLVSNLANRMRRKEIEKLYKELQEEKLRRSQAESRSLELEQLLPICASCKKVRDDEGYWHKVEHYMEHHLKQQTTHGFCPDCLKKLYPDFAEEAINGDTPKYGL